MSTYCVKPELDNRGGVALVEPPDPEETELGEGGERLGHQAQARLRVRQAALLILDENPRANA